ncbi:hypothetical protein V2G26_007216 [Clonostachys chloroleuca]
MQADSKCYKWDSPTEQDSIRRFQTLHVYEFHRTHRRSSVGRRSGQLLHLLPAQIASWVLLMGLAVFFILFGCYGTSAIVICSTLSEIVAHNVKIVRPPTYLKNSERHDACMLVAAHENATEWHLYLEHRAIVDSLLNKQMFVVPSGPRIRFAAAWFWFAHLFQLAAVTFVAAQKGLLDNFEYTLGIRPSISFTFLNYFYYNHKINRNDEFCSKI